MVDPLAELVELFRAVGSEGYVVIGGLAVRLLAGEQNARETRDIDIVAKDAAGQGRMLSHLRSIGYQIGVSGGWYRAAMAGSPRPVIDIASHPVVNPRTFEALTSEELLGRPAAEGQLKALDQFLQDLQKEGL